MRLPRPSLPSAPDLRRGRDGVLRAVSLVVTDRRWAAPLSAMALGFGLFLGVAIGPGAQGTMATGGPPLLALVSPDEEVEAVGAVGGGAGVGSGGGGEAWEEEAGFGEGEAAYVPAPADAESAPAPPAPRPRERGGGSAGEAAEEAVGLRGTVVATSSAARGYALALPGGELAAVHATELPEPGAKLAVEATPLPNNTFAEDGRGRDGTARQAILRGVVTHVGADPAAPRYTVSGRGASLLVHADLGAAPPALGAQVTVTVEIAAGGLDADDGTAVTLLRQRELVAEAEPATYLDLAGLVAAHDGEARRLRLSADWTGESGAELSLAVPERFDLAELRPGAAVVATATLAPDGSLTLAGIAGDAGRKGAEAIATAQGDLARAARSRSRARSR